MSPSRRRLVGGLDLGGTKIQAVVLDGRRQVVAEAKRPTPARGGGKAVIALGATLAEVCTDAGVETATWLEWAWDPRAPSTRVAAWSAAPATCPAVARRFAWPPASNA